MIFQLTTLTIMDRDMFGIISLNFIDGNWHMITLLVNSNELKYYFDNNLIYTRSTTITSSPNNSVNLSFGRYSSSNIFYAGTIDDVSIHNRVLSAQEIQQLYSGSPNYTHLWSPGGETTSSITVQPTATTTYIVDVTSGTTTCTSDPTTITVQPLPTVDLGSDVELCNGATQTLDAGSHSSYLWSTGEITQTIDITTAGTYFVRVQDATGCEASDTIIATEKTLALDAGIDQTICEGSSATLTASASSNTSSGSDFSNFTPSLGDQLIETITLSYNSYNTPTSNSILNLNEVYYFKVTGSGSAGGGQFFDGVGIILMVIQ